MREYLNCESLYDGCKTKLSLLDGYIAKMADLVCWGTQDEGNDSISVREEQIERYKEMVQNAKA